METREGMELTLGDFLELEWGNLSGIISIMALVLLALVQGINFQFFTRLIFRILSELAGVFGSVSRTMHHSITLE